MKIYFDVKNQIITRTDRNQVIANSADYLEAEITFSEDWTGYEKTMTFKNGNLLYTYVLANDKILEENHLNLGVGTWKVSIQGVNEDKKIVTNECNLAVNASGWIGSEALPPESIWNQLLVIIQSLHTEVASTAALRSAVQKYIEDNYDALVKEAVIVDDVRTALDDMAEDGTLSDLLAPLVAAGMPEVVADQISAVVAAQIGGVVANQIGAVVASQITTPVNQAVKNYCDDNFSGWSGALDRGLAQPLMAAPADMVGAIKSALNNYIKRLPKETQIQITPEAGIVDTSLVAASTSTSRIKHCHFSVSEGEKYKVTCYAKNTTYPAAFVYNSQTEAYSVLKTGIEAGFSDVEITIPSGYDTLYLNTCYQNTDYPLTAKKLETWTDEEFWNFIWKVNDETGYDDNTKVVSPKLFVKYDNEKVYVIISKLFHTSDVMVVFEKKGANNIFDFSRTFYVPNTTNAVSSDTTIVQGNRITVDNNTDWVSPYVVFADNNIDGDDTSASYFTGGVHGYQGATGSGISSTGRTTSVKVYADGVEVSDGSFAYADLVELVWTNRVQASNTEKSDGTGREVLEETIRVTIDAKKINVSNEITALEDISFEKYYGISIPHLVDSSSKRYYIGSRNNRGANNMAQSGNSGDKNCKLVRLTYYTHDIYMGLNELDLCDEYYNEDAYSFLSSSVGKTYSQLIKSDNHSVHLSANNKMYWSGFYQFNGNL